MERPTAIGLDFDNALSTTPQPNTWQRAGQLFLLNNGLAGSWNWRQKRDRFRQYRCHRRAYSAASGPHQPQPSLLHGDLWSGNCALVRMARTFSTRPATGVTESATGDVTAAY